MKEFTVTIKEVYAVPVIVMANSKEEAIKLVQDGDGNYLDGEYSHTLAPETWEIK